MSDKKAVFKCEKCGKELSGSEAYVDVYDFWRSGPHTKCLKCLEEHAKAVGDLK